jgi:hypothetical protein
VPLSFRPGSPLARLFGAKEERSISPIDTSYFPGYRDPRPDAQPGPGWGWPALLLPFVAQANLHARIDPDRTTLGNGSDVTVPTPQTLTPLAVYRCPSDPGPPANPNYDGHATASYRGVGWGRPRTAPARGD